MIVAKVIVRPVRQVTLRVVTGRGPRGPEGPPGSGGGGGVSTETVQSMINAEVGPTAPDPTLIFDQFLI